MKWMSALVVVLAPFILTTHAAAENLAAAPLIIQISAPASTSTASAAPSESVSYESKLADLLDSVDTRQQDKSLTPAEIQPVREKLLGCWMVPAAAVDDIGSYYAEVHVTMKPDGKPAGSPVVVTVRAPNAAASVAFEAEVLKALDRCSPYGFAKGKYSLWERVIFRFDAMGRNASIPTQAYKGPDPIPTPATESAAANRTLSQEELGMLRRAISKHWSAPQGKFVVTLNMKLDKSGNVISVQPVFFDDKPRPPVEFVTAAVTAVYKATPLDFLPVEKYESWKEIQISFDPELMKP